MSLVSWPFVPFVLAAVFLLFPRPLFAQRPFLDTEVAVPIERGRYRLEGGLNFNRFSSDRKSTLLSVNLRYGLIQNLEFNFEMPFLFVDGPEDNKKRAGDFRLNTKIRFLKGRAANPLSVAGLMAIKFPTAGRSKALGTSGVVDVGFLAIASKAFSPVTTHINMGYYFIGNPAGTDLPDQIRYALGLEAAMPEAPIKALAEITGRADLGSSPSNDQALALVGFSIQLQSDLIFDTSVGFSLNRNSPDYVINSGLSYALRR